MKIACLSFSSKGKELGHKIESSLDVKHYNNRELEFGVKGFIRENWKNYDGFIFIGAAGIATRYIAPYIEDKYIDPAVLVVDDLGRYVIPILSGHIGGGNELSRKLAQKIGGQEIITTATDGRKIQAIDLFALENSYLMEDRLAITKITALMVDGKKIGFYSDYEKVIAYKNLEIIKDLENISNDIDGVIIVSSKDIDLDLPYARLIPRDINIGIGSRRGIKTQKVIDAIGEALEEISLNPLGIRALGTVEIKKDEAGIIEAADYFGVPLVIFTIDELKKVESFFKGSDFVRKTIGVGAVAEPAAYLMGKDMLMEKTKRDGITISISKGGSNG